jgi:LPS sulfotransferase NodH
MSGLSRPALPKAPRIYDLVTARHDYPPRDAPVQRTLLICTHPRSGSTLLGEALYFAGGLGCPLEYFHRGFRPALEQRWGTRGIHEYVHATHRYRTAPNGIFSAKLFWQDVEELIGQLDPARFPPREPIPAEQRDPPFYRDVLACLADIFPNPTFVHLVRQDRVRQAVSSLLAVQTGLWRAIPELGEREPRAEPIYDYDRIAALVALSDYSHGHWAKFYDACGILTYTLYYEDLDDNYATTLARLWQYLGHEDKVAVARMRRQGNAHAEAFVRRFLTDYQRQTTAAIGGST